MEGTATKISPKSSPPVIWLRAAAIGVSLLFVHPTYGDDEVEIVEGMTMVFEPVIWEDGLGGFRSEELVAVTATGCERLSAHDYRPFEEGTSR